MSTEIRKGKFIYKDQESLNKMHAFYDKTLTALGVPYSEDYFETSFGKTHCLLVGDKDKPRICTIRGLSLSLQHPCTGCNRNAGKE